MEEKTVVFEGVVGNSSIKLYGFNKPYKRISKTGRRYTVNEFGHNLMLASLIRRWVGSFNLKRVSDR